MALYGRTKEAKPKAVSVPARRENFAEISRRALKANRPTASTKLYGAKP